MKNALTKTPFRRFALGGTAVLGAGALIITTLPAQAEDAANAPTVTECEAEEILSDEDNPDSIGHTVDSSGNWIGGRIYPAYTIRLWNDGELIDVDLPGRAPEVLGVNAAGTTVGLVYRGADDTTVPYAFVDNEVVLMSAESNDDNAGAWARSINDDGVIAGVSMTTNLDPINALRWESYDAEPEVLPLPDGALSADARHISENGTVVGFYLNEDEKRVPYMWDAEGTGHELPGVDDSGPAEGTANDITGDWIVGPDEAGDSALVWGPDSQFATEITDLDSVAGVSANGDFAGAAGDTPTLVTADGDVVSLPGPDGAEVEGRATAINDDGTVVTGTIKNPENQAMLWRCS